MQPSGGQQIHNLSRSSEKRERKADKAKGRQKAKKEIRDTRED